MTSEEIVQLLAFACTYDSRVTTGRPETLAWYAALGRFSAKQATEAVIAHYKVSTERIMPAHIVTYCRSQPPPPAQFPELPPPSRVVPPTPEYLAARKALIEKLAVRASELLSADEVPEWRPGMDKQKLALAQVEASRRRAALFGRGPDTGAVAKGEG